MAGEENARGQISPRLDRWIEAAEGHGVTALVANLRSRVGRWQDWPLSINDAEYDNAYTASLYNTYITYLSKELGPLPRPAQWLIRGCLAGCGLGFRLARFNRVVQLNNWLLSTNPIPPAFPERWPELVAAYPGHSLVWRSLNQGFHQPLLDRLQSEGWWLIPSRLIYRFDGTGAAYLRKDDVRRDLRLLADDRFGWKSHVSFQPEDWHSVAYLYNQLYRVKYPTENPQFTARFFELAANQLGWNILLLQDGQARSVGVTGWWLNDGVMVGTVVGYRLDLPRSWGLYRRLMTRVLLEAAEQRVWLNMSSGAGAFKRSRGGLPTLEFMAVYARHLPCHRQIPYRGLSWLLNRYGVPLLKRYG